jgi:ABC-2 type transport system permease protein
MHNVTVSLSLGIIGEAALTIIYFLKQTLLDGLVVRFFHWFSVIERYDNFLMGMLDLSAIIYYISIVFLFLFLTVQSIKKSRWN